MQIEDGTGQLFPISWKLVGNYPFYFFFLLYEQTGVPLEILEYLYLKVCMMIILNLSRFKECHKFMTIIIII